MKTIDEISTLLEKGNYVADRSLATALFLALKMQRPLLLEGEAGVGKTEIAKVLSSQLHLPLIRLQCYEGLDVAQSLYEWNYAKQMLTIKQEKGDHNLFGVEFLQKRPLLQALETPCVLLIDELDRTDDAFEAFLLELLSDFQVTIPELGVIKAHTKPIVLLTSNRTREIHDALKRRCLYYWVNYPNSERELEILKRKVPQASALLSAQIVAFIQKLRTQELYKAPGLAETIDWATALTELDALALDTDLVESTLGVLLKYQEDLAKIQGNRAKLLLDEVKNHVG